MTDKQNNANLINQTSGDFEYYTPEPWPNLARCLMGQIDLDPASNEVANQRIKAVRYYTEEQDGLSLPWAGKVWMNHPFHRGELACPDNTAKCKKKTCKKRGYHITQDIAGNDAWINKLITEYQNGAITEAVIICFCSSSEGWFRPLLKFPQLFPDGRVNYKRPDGSNAVGVTKGSVITYLGQNTKGFAKLFGPYGTIKIQYNAK